VEKRGEKERSPAAEDNSREWWSNAHSTMTTAINQGKHRRYAGDTMKQEAIQNTTYHRHTTTTTPSHGEVELHISLNP
jgi:hypothetical protein